MVRVDNTFSAQWFDPGRLVWTFPLFGRCQDHDAPAAWTRACAAVARDLRHLRHGREVVLDGLWWELTLDGGYRVTAGWRPGPAYTGDVGGFNLGRGLTDTTPAAHVAAWVAEIAQDELAGYEFVQWPTSRGGRLLTPAVRDGQALWIDPHTAATRPIGQLTADT